MRLLFEPDRLLGAFEPENLLVLLRSLLYAVITTVLCLLHTGGHAAVAAEIAHGTYYQYAFCPSHVDEFLLRTYAWQAILDMNGPINALLNFLGGHCPTSIQRALSSWALCITFCRLCCFPSTHVSKDGPRSDRSGAGFRRRTSTASLACHPSAHPSRHHHRRITMVFMPAVTTFVISRLLGGSHFMMFGDLLENQFMLLKDWNTGSALAVVMMVLLLLSMAIMRKYDKDER